MRSKSGAVIANLVMETLSELQRTRQKSSVKHIKAHIFEKYGNRVDKFVNLIPQYINKGVSLGLIAKYGDNYRTKMYVARRRKRGKGGKRRRRRRK